MEYILTSLPYIIIKTTNQNQFIPTAMVSRVVVVCAWFSLLVKIVQATEPLPTCDEVGIDISQWNIQACDTFCNAVGQPVDVFRDVNGVTKCSCKGDLDICSDDPTCAQLQIFPGTVADDCESLCGDGVTTTITDDIEFAGSPSAGNKAQTHLKVACSCGATKRCDDRIKFSDLNFPKSCWNDLNITEEHICEKYCVDNGFFEGYEWFRVNTLANCTCYASDGMALACGDLTSEELDDEMSPESGSTVLEVVRFVGILMGAIAFLCQ